MCRMARPVLCKQMGVLLYQGLKPSIEYATRWIGASANVGGEAEEIVLRFRLCCCDQERFCRHTLSKSLMYDFDGLCRSVKI